MSEQTPEPQTESVQEAPKPAGEEQQPEKYDREYVERLRRETAKFRSEAKANAEAAKRLAELEDAQKTDAEKLTGRVEAAERERDEVRSQLLRLQVAVEKGLTQGQAKRLVGSTREELEADADELLAEFSPKQESPPSFDGGVRMDPQLGDTSPRGLIAAGLAQNSKSRRR